jgi:hypothetical protein
MPDENPHCGSLCAPVYNFYKYNGSGMKPNTGIAAKNPVKPRRTATQKKIPFCGELSLTNQKNVIRLAIPVGAINMVLITGVLKNFLVTEFLGNGQNTNG